MVKTLVCYYTRSGNTKAMAIRVADGARAAGSDVDLRKVSEVTPADLLKYDCIIMGSPTYYGTCAAELKSLIDKSVKYHGELAGKIGGAFATCGVQGGGNETTVQQILEALLIHGMIIIGDTDGAHYGPVAIEKPSKANEKTCFEYGKRLAKLAIKLHG
jgi:NAD(P)H dehydrogenase (quinone)